MKGPKVSRWKKIVEFATTIRVLFAVIITINYEESSTEARS